MGNGDKGPGDLAAISQTSSEFGSKTTIDHRTVRAIGQVIKPKSADGIVPTIIGDDFREGPNISQEAARFISIQRVELAVKRGSES